MARRRVSLSPEERVALRRVLRKRKADGIEVRRVNALNLDKGNKAASVESFLYLDDDTARDRRATSIASIR
ncbi:MAG: hypothetical protein OXI87_06800 [Albidovulum sp.]|nr:hypothetical protein [Albidovulum sp.]MDE0531485.1 hypothetical protein [Albidovulum sp.]